MSELLNAAVIKNSLFTAVFSIALSAAGAQMALASDVLKSPAPPEGASTYIVSPQDGAEVTSPVTVVFGLKGMGIAPAGIEKEGTGHHHLLVDQQELPPLNAVMGNPPLHFGGGQNETELELEPGEHTLQLILGNHLHVPFDPMVLSEKITITVKE